MVEHAQPGDIVRGDLNDVVVVPHGFAEELLDRILTRTADEADGMEAGPRCESSNTRVDRLLEENDVHVERMPDWV